MSDRNIEDEDAQDALRYGGKSGKAPTHPAMRTEEEREAEAEDNDDYDWDDDNKGT